MKKLLLMSLLLSVCFQSYAKSENDVWWALGAAGLACGSCALGGLLGNYLSGKRADQSRRADITNLQQHVYAVQDCYADLSRFVGTQDAHACALLIHERGFSYAQYFQHLTSDIKRLHNLQVRCASYSLHHADPVVREVARAYNAMEHTVDHVRCVLKNNKRFLRSNSTYITHVCRVCDCVDATKSYERKYASIIRAYIQAQGSSIYELERILCSTVQACGLWAHERYALISFVDVLSHDCTLFEKHGHSFSGSDRGVEYRAYKDLLYVLQDILKVVSQGSGYREQKQCKQNDRLQEELLSIEREKLDVERDRLSLEYSKIEQAERMERSLNRVRNRLNCLLDRLDDQQIYSEVHQIVIDL